MRFRMELQPAVIPAQAGTQILGRGLVGVQPLTKGADAITRCEKSGDRFFQKILLTQRITD